MEFTDTFFHEHTLMLTDDDEQRRIRLCDACDEEIPAGPFYSCHRCNFVMHKSCAELPREFQNPYHPHPLTLVTDRREGEGDFNCFACGICPPGFSFHCGECKFDLDIKCVRWKPTTDEGQYQLHHPSHLHPLVATEKKKKLDKEDDDVCCKMCKEPCFDDEPAYACDPCNFYLHQSCAALQLLPTLRHVDHPCLLTLCPKIQSFKCDVCGDWAESYSYLCKSCDFWVEMSCTLLTSGSQQQFQHFSHGHCLELTEIKHDDEILCSGCAGLCSGQTYVCCIRKCKFFLHNSCFNLPHSIHHPFHPLHPLTLSSLIEKPNRKECKICYRFCSGLAYFCRCCKFYMHVQCPVIISSIKYLGHPHIILFVDGLDPIQPHGDDDPTSVEEKTVLLCSVCGTTCEYSTAMFRCVECDIHLHFRCGPLPYFIKHEDHMCPLKLIDSPVMIEGEDKDNDEFYCDACEKKRDPRLPIYYCTDRCRYIAEIECVMSEVLLSLSGEFGEVELRSAIFKYQTGKVICKGMVKATEVTSDQDREVGGYIDRKVGRSELYLPRMIKEYLRVFDGALNHDTWLSNEKIFSYYDDYIKFMALIDRVSIQNHETLKRFLENDNDDLMTPFLAAFWGNVTPDQDRMIDYLSKDKLNGGNFFTVVSAGNHSVISELATIFEDLCAKYGDDIVPDSADLSSWETTFFISSLCETIKGMCTIRVADISERKLLSWWRSLGALRLHGFEVKFAFDRLERVADAYYALQVEKTVKEDVEQIDKRIEEISQQMKKLEAEQTALKEERRKRSEAPKPATSSKVTKCFKEKSVLKWMTAGEGLL